MRMLERNGKIIYHSKRRLTDDGVEYFDVPVGLRANPMPLSTDWTQAEKGFVERDMKRFLISRELLRETIIFNPYGYDHAIEGESYYGLDEDNPYGWIEEYMTRWINDLLNGDRFYVDVLPPDDYVDSNMANNADYVVTGIEDTPNYVGVILKRLAV